MNCHLNERSKTMQTYITKIFLVPALIAELNLIPAGRVTAQTFTVLHNFTPTINSGPPYPTLTNSDGAQPFGALIANSSSNTLYGTAKYGGNSGVGAVFALNTDGPPYTNPHIYTAGGYPTRSDFTSNDGAQPYAGLILSGNALYGAALDGGSDNGTVFALNTNGTGFTNLYSFTPSPRPGTNT